MSIALWCIAVGALMPLLWAWYAKAKGRFGLRDNHNPREFMDKLTGQAQRANWAQQNALEAFPQFAAAVLVASHVGKIAPDTLNALALAWVALRLAYGVLYIADLAKLRSVVWSLAMACWVAMFALSM